MLKLRIGQDDMTIGVLADDVREVIDIWSSRRSRVRLESEDRSMRASSRASGRGRQLTVILDIDKS